MAKKEYQEFSLHNILRVRSNVASINEFLFCFSTAVASKNDGSTVIVESVKKITIDKVSFRRIGDFLYNQNDDALYFELPYPFKVQLLVSGIASGNTLIQATPAFIHLPTVLRGGINFMYLVREIILLKLIDQGYIFLHSACLQRGNNGLVFSAFANTGKTYLSFSLVKSGFARLLSDEYAIVHRNAKAYSFFGISALAPKTIKAFRIPINLSEKIWMGFCQLRARLLPFLFEPVIWVPSTRVFSQAERAEETSLSYIIFLERGKDKLIPISKQETIEKLILLSENEFPFSSNYLLQVYSYVNRDFDLPAYSEKERLILQDIVKGSRGSFILSYEFGNQRVVESLLTERLK